MRRWCLLPRARLRGGSFSKPRGFYLLRVVACWLGSGLEGWFASVLEYRSLERRVCAVYVAQGSGYRGLIRLADPSLLRGLEVDIWPFGYLTDVDGELTPRRLRSILAISRASSRFVSTRLVAGEIRHPHTPLLGYHTSCISTSWTLFEQLDSPSQCCVYLGTTASRSIYLSIYLYHFLYPSFAPVISPSIYLASFCVYFFTLGSFYEG